MTRPLLQAAKSTLSAEAAFIVHCNAFEVFLSSAQIEKCETRFFLLKSVDN